MCPKLSRGKLINLAESLQKRLIHVRICGCACGNLRRGSVHDPTVYIGQTELRTIKERALDRPWGLLTFPQRCRWESNGALPAIALPLCPMHLRR